MNTKDEQNIFKNSAKKILMKYPDKVPVIFSNSPGTPPIDKRKFIMPRDLQISQILYIIRKKIKLEPHQGIFLYFGKNNMANSNLLLSEVYELFKDKDDILYATYSIENTFGSNL
jgi:GABA(A) receptor-associated protein